MTQRKVDDHVDKRTKKAPETNSEIEQARQRYKGTPQWMKAPNGNPTKLSEEQWLQVRTPSFKKQFGDWELTFRIKDESKIFSEAIDDFLGGKLGDKPVIVGKISEVLRKLGAADLPVIIDKDTLRKVLEEKHDIPTEILKKLPFHLHDPIMVFISKTELNSLVVMTELTFSGKTIVAAVHLSKRVGRHVVNDVASVHPRKYDSHFLNWIDDGYLVYAHKAKSRRWFITRGLQSPKVRGTSNDSKQRILDDSQLVKPAALSSIDMNGEPILGKSGSDIKKAKGRVNSNPVVISKLEKSNFKLEGKTNYQGIPISIENAPGSTRFGADPDGHEWRTTMQVTYGRIPWTRGADGDAVDVFVNESHPLAENAYVVHILDPQTGDYDEDKVFLGFDSKREVWDAFKQHYDNARKVWGFCEKMPVSFLKAKLGIGEKKPSISKANPAWPSENRDRYGRWMKTGGDFEDWDKLIIQDPTPESAKNEFNKLYYEKDFYAFNPFTKTNDLLVIFDKDAWHHACFEPKNREEYNRQIGKQNREAMREEFSKERASKIRWIGRVLLDPDEIRKTKYKDVSAYWVTRKLPTGGFYGVMLTGDLKAGYIRFSSAYPVKPSDSGKVRQNAAIYKKEKPDQEFEKSLSGLEPATALWLRSIPRNRGGRFGTSADANLDSPGRFASSRTSSSPTCQKPCNLLVRKGIQTRQPFSGPSPCSNSNIAKLPIVFKFKRSA